MKIIMLGKPGAGKGRHSQSLADNLQIPVISTGNLFREHLRLKTPVGLRIEQFMNNGLLVPDDLTIRTVRERLSEKDCQNGYILDGFPRTLPQAEALAAMTDIDFVIELCVPDETILERMSGRRFCEICNLTYHTKYDPPKTEGICDRCRRPLSVRADDLPETVLQRLRVYHQQTEPLSAFYKDLGKLLPIDACASPEEVARRILQELKL